MERVAKKEFKPADTDSGIIADLQEALEDLVHRRKQPGEGILIEARELAREWKVKGRPLFGEGSTMLLAALVVALKREVELLERIRSRFPDKLEELQSAVLYAQIREFREALESAQDKPTPRQVSEKKRSKWHRHFHNSIEYQFGGGLVADLRKYTALRGLSDAELQWLGATCLDKIFAGDPVNMQTLEDLFFGIGRKRLGKLLLGGRKKRWYDWRDVIRIMESLLKETQEFLLKEKERKRKKPVLGPPRKVWLYDKKDPDLLPRVVKRIEARLNSFSVDEDIKAAFLKVVYDHLQGIGN
jgi:hypothetical protein